MPAVTSELFGLENFATNYAIIMLGPAAGAVQLADRTMPRSLPAHPTEPLQCMPIAKNTELR